MKTAPAGEIVAKPAMLPVFDDAWKAKCRSCKHLLARPNNAMRCALVRTGNNSKWIYCIDHREPGAACAPGAALWEAGS